MAAKTNIPKVAMVLGAGLGKRMRPITDTIPKPLVQVGGKALIDWGLDSLVDAGVTRVIVNVHYLADNLEAHLRIRKDVNIAISDEREALLESGGGIIKALPLIGSEPFFLVNSDTFWLDGARSNLVAMAEYFDAAKMDILLMLATSEQATGHGAATDFVCGAGGRLVRYKAGDANPFIYAGVAILHPRIFNGALDGAHSLNREFNVAIENGRLYGLPMDGQWLTVGTPDAIAPAEAVVAVHRTRA